MTKAGVLRERGAPAFVMGPGYANAPGTATIGRGPFRVTDTTKAGAAHATPAFVVLGSRGVRGTSPRTPRHHNRLIRVPPYTVLYPITYPLENC